MLGFVALFGLFVGVVGFGAIYQTLATRRDRRKFLPPGKMIEVHGNRLHYQAMGAGQPTVVIESGQGATHLDWQLVQPEIAKFTQIVTYDRAGYGWSDLSANPRTAQHIVDDLRQLLQNAGIAPPYVLVGMSLSGIFVRLFAYQYPEEVAGMVLVSVAHERMYESMPPDMVKLNQQFDWLAIHVLPIAARIGLFRLLVTLDRLPLAAGLFKKLRPDLQFAAKSIYARTQFWQTLGQESAGFPTSLQQIEKVRGACSFPNIPLRVLSSGKPDFGASLELIESMQALDADLARESPQGVQVIVEQSGHAIQLDEPEQVIDAIRQVVEQARYGSRCDK
ncbi:alpha/beta hydrolase fold protein [Leptolyngbya sp. NIES-3755]|nr:alpha/beta hydrolase fold protein [Leptolyngbya sp. NIES-3755]